MEKIVIRINSHRANAKLKRLVPDVVAVFESSFRVPGNFAFIASTELELALSVKGVNKARDQNNDHYSPCWTMH